MPTTALQSTVPPFHTPCITQNVVVAKLQSQLNDLLNIQITAIHLSRALPHGILKVNAVMTRSYR